MAKSEITGDDEIRTLLVDGDSNDLEKNQKESAEDARARESSKGEIVKSVVEAGLHGIFTFFSLMASLSATQRSSVDVLVLSCANLVAGGISMGFDSYVSSYTEEDMTLKEKEETKCGVNEHGRPQQQELLQHYQALGMDRDDASMVVEVFAKYKDVLVDEKMTAQKGTPPPDQGREKPWMTGLVNFGSFITFGSSPLLSFVILLPFTDRDWLKFIGACVLSVLALAILGVAKAEIAGQNSVRSVAGVLFNGTISATAAYALGWILSNVAEHKD